MTRYLKNYCKGVKPRYRDNYKDIPCIVTQDKAVMEITVKGLKAQGKTVTVTKQGGIYTVKELVKLEKEGLSKKVKRLFLTVFHLLTFKVFTIKIKGLDY